MNIKDIINDPNINWAQRKETLPKKTMYWLVTAKSVVGNTNLEMLKNLADKSMGIVVDRVGPNVEDIQVIYVSENMCLLDMDVVDNLEYAHLGEETTSPQHVEKWYADQGFESPSFLERRKESAKLFK